MKIIAAIIISFCCFFCLSSELHADLNDGLIAHYPLDGNPNDISPTGNDGVENGGISYVSGVDGMAATFDGADDYIEVTGVDISLNDFSVSIWLKPNMTPDWNYKAAFAIHSGDLGHTHKGDKSVFTWVNSNWALINVLAVNNDSVGESNTSQIIPNEWNHIVFMRSGSSLKTYLNGELVDSRNSTQGTFNFTNGLIHIGAPNYYGLGGWTTNGRDTAKWRGELDELRIYNRAITKSEISQLWSDIESAIKIQKIEIHIRDEDSILAPECCAYGDNPYSNEGKDYKIPWAQGNDFNRVFMNIKLTNDSDFPVDLNMKALFSDNDGNQMELITEDFQTIPSKETTKLVFPSKVIKKFEGKRFFSFNLKILGKEISGDWKLIQNLTGKEHYTQNGIVDFFGWENCFSKKSLPENSPYILHLTANYQQYYFDALCTHYDLSPPLEAFMEHASDCLSGVWEDYVDYKDKKYNQKFDDDVKGIHDGENEGNDQKKYIHMTRLYALLTNTAYKTTIEETEKAIEAASRGITCLVNEDIANTFKQNVNTCYAKWDACWEACSNDENCKIKDIKAEYRKRMYKNQEFSYGESMDESDCDACEYDNGWTWWPFSQRIDLFTLSDDDMNKGIVKLDPMTSMSYEGIASVLDFEGQRGVLLGAETLESTASRSTEASYSVADLSDLTIFFDTPVSKFIVTMYDCSGQTLISTFNKFGEITHTLDVTSDILQDYEIDNLGPIYVINISSSCAWVGQIQYDALGAENDKLFICSDGNCYNNLPCFNALDNAMEWAIGGTKIFVEADNYEEEITLDEHKQIYLSGGWNKQFDRKIGETISSSLVITRGTMFIDGLIIGGIK